MHYMQAALSEAEIAFKADEVPVGAVIVYKDKIISKAHNLCKQKNNPLLHAEILVVKESLEKLNTSYLSECDLYVTLEPCAMCAASIAQVRMRKVIFGAYDTKSGGVEHGARIFDHSHYKPDVVGGVLESESKEILQKFFSLKR